MLLKNKRNKDLKEQAILHFKSKQIAKKNKDRILNILNKIKFFNIEDEIYFSNSIRDGIFFLEFEQNSIAWFFIKEFPDWKFGIWLYNDNTFDIFGNAITLIDKFKPSYSILCKQNINDFNKELTNILNNKTLKWKKYSTSIKKSKLQDKKNNEYNDNVFKKINTYIEDLNKEYEKGNRKSYLKLIDRNTKDFEVLPRYIIEEFFNSKKYMESKDSEIETKRLYKELSNLIEYTGNYNKNYSDYIVDDEYLFENLILINPKDYDEKAKLYNLYIKKFNEFVDKKLLI